MSTKSDEATMRKLHLLGAAGRLVDLMYTWNVIDLNELVIEDSRSETPYYHVTSALGKILALLGVTDPERKMDFYDMVTTGMSPVEALARIREFEADRAGEEL